MINLILKDILIQKKTFIYASLYAFFALVAFTDSFSPSGGYMFGGISIVYLLILYANGYDEKNKSEVIMNSLPVTRENIVISKYLSIILYMIFSIVITGIVGIILTRLGVIKNIRVISLSDIFGIFISVGLMYSIYYPMYFKFGTLKLKVFNIVLYMLFLFVPNIVSEYIQKNPNSELINGISNFFNNISSGMLQFGGIVFVLLLFLLSLILSIKIYKNKEF